MPSILHGPQNHGFAWRFTGSGVEREKVFRGDASGSYGNKPWEEYEEEAGKGMEEGT